MNFFENQLLDDYVINEGSFFSGPSSYADFWKKINENINDQKTKQLQEGEPSNNLSPYQSLEICPVFGRENTNTDSSLFREDEFFSSDFTKESFSTLIENSSSLFFSFFPTSSSQKTTQPFKFITECDFSDFYQFSTEEKTESPQFTNKRVPSNSNRVFSAKNQKIVSDYLFGHQNQLLINQLNERMKSIQFLPISPNPDFTEKLALIPNDLSNSQKQIKTFLSSKKQQNFNFFIQLEAIAKPKKSYYKYLFHLKENHLNYFTSSNNNNNINDNNNLSKNNLQFKYISSKDLSKLDSFQNLKNPEIVKDAKKFVNDYSLEYQKKTSSYQIEIETNLNKKTFRIENEGKKKKKKETADFPLLIVEVVLREGFSVFMEPFQPKTRRDQLSRDKKQKN